MKPMRQCRCNVLFFEKNFSSSQCIRNFVSCTSHEFDNVVTPCYPFCAPFKYQVVAHRRLKTKEHFKLVALKVTEVVAYKRVIVRHE